MKKSEKLKSKLKNFGAKIKASAKKNPKLYGTIAAVVIVASGGSATGVIETATFIQQIGEMVEIVSAVSE